MDTTTQWTIAGLVFVLILLIILLFTKTHFLTFFTIRRGWEKLDENSGILEHTSTLSHIPVHYQSPYDKAANLCYSSPFDGFIKMNYGIQDDKEAKQYLVPSEDIECQLVVEAASPEIHLTPVTPERRISDEQVPCANQLRRGISTESLDSCTSSIMEMNREVPTANLTLKYDEPTQMLSVQLHHLSDVYSDYGQIWMLFFLLPHPKPLWRTEARATPASLIDYGSIYQQCIRKADLNKIALLIQLFSCKNQSASIVAQARIRFKDLSLATGRDTSVELALLPSKSKNPSEETRENVKLGEILFLASFAHDRLTVIVSKIRSLSNVYKNVFIRLYLVQQMGQVVKKKTSERILIDGAADIAERVAFTVSRNRLMKSHLRLSIVCGTDEYCKSIGHVTLGPKTSGKMHPGVAALIASVLCTTVFLLIYFDNGRNLKLTYGKHWDSLRSCSSNESEVAPSISVAPEAWFREFFEKTASSRVTYLSSSSRYIHQDIRPGTLFNVLAPEVFCPYTIRVGSLDDGGKFVCNPPKTPKNCSIYSIGIAGDISFDEAIQEFNNFTCRIFGYEKENISSSILEQYAKINGKLQQLELASFTDAKNNRYALGDLVERNNDESVEFLKMDIEGAEHQVLTPFLERYKVCQIFVELHSTPSDQISLLSRIAKLNYALFSHEINGHAPSLNEYSFIHLDCIQTYGAYMLKRYLNKVKVPE
ncbi:hypothetical protein GCK32_005066 [Trichostrongylus colubriformis]|uniref:Methyltransferase domain-containing protein n=1 Tax=Trichostrongylus colubriformis TaxID=6319 RepID=A0AAN8F4C6_TRICO